MSASVEEARWVLSYPSHPDKGRWHKVNRLSPHETICSRLQSLGLEAGEELSGHG